MPNMYISNIDESKAFEVNIIDEQLKGLPIKAYFQQGDHVYESVVAGTTINIPKPPSGSYLVELVFGDNITTRQFTILVNKSIAGDIINGLSDDMSKSFFEAYEKIKGYLANPDAFKGEQGLPGQPGADAPLPDMSLYATKNDLQAIPKPDMTAYQTKAITTENWAYPKIRDFCDNRLKVHRNSRHNDTSRRCLN